MRLVSQPPKNQNGARNRGVPEALTVSWRSLTITRWRARLISPAVLRAERHPRADVVGGPIRLEAAARRLCQRCWRSVFGWRGEQGEAKDFLGGEHAHQERGCGKYRLLQ
jgi:hypothetical protein